MADPNSSAQTASWIGVLALGLTFIANTYRERLKAKRDDRADELSGRDWVVTNAKDSAQRATDRADKAEKRADESQEQVDELIKQNRRLQERISKLEDRVEELQAEIVLLQNGRTS